MQSLRACGPRRGEDADAAARRIGHALAGAGWKVRLQQRTGTEGAGWMVAARAGAANKLGAIAARMAPSC